MHPPLWTVLPGLILLAYGCDSYRGPRLAVPTSATRDQASSNPEPIDNPGRTSVSYKGSTMEQWVQGLRSPDSRQVADSCQALTVLGHEGRSQLFQGLESSHAETRRLCLEHLSISDFKKHGESGRRLLVKLAADRSDIRIRERAAGYLAQWHGTIPSP
jgi:hypothetical protein